MSLNAAAQLVPSSAIANHSRSERVARAISLGDLVALVASTFPEEDVAATVDALFAHGIAAFPRELSATSRALLRAAGASRPE